MVWILNIIMEHPWSFLIASAFGLTGLLLVGTIIHDAITNRPKKPRQLDTRRTFVFEGRIFHAYIGDGTVCVYDEHNRQIPTVYDVRTLHIWANKGRAAARREKKRVVKEYKQGQKTLKRFHKA